MFSIGKALKVCSDLCHQDGEHLPTHSIDLFAPFENAGAQSIWKLDLPKDYRAFYYDTISDVILHIRYTAHQSVDPTKVKTALDGLFQQASQSNLALLFSLRDDFPTEWSAFVNGTANFTPLISLARRREKAAELARAVFGVLGPFGPETSW